MIVLRALFLPIFLMAFLTSCHWFSLDEEPPIAYRHADWNELDLISNESLTIGFDAWQSGCSKMIARKPETWQGYCDAAKTVDSKDSEAVVNFIKQHFELLQIVQEDGHDEGLITGYYEPILDGRLTPEGPYQHPVHGRPDDLIRVDLGKLYPELKGKRVRGRLVNHRLIPYGDRDAIVEPTNPFELPVLAYLSDPMDVEFLQIQGSGRISLQNGDLLRVGYADQNGHPYRPVGRWLLENKLLKKEDISMQSIRQWAKDNPDRVDEMLDYNPSYVFFRALPDVDEGPIGSLGVPLTDGYSLAVDRKVTPLGSLMIIETSLPALISNQEDPQPEVSIKRLAVAQDTGGAIRGQVRADLFVGTGDEAGQIAGLMKQKGRLWVFWPKNRPLPSHLMD